MSSLEKGAEILASGVPGPNSVIGKVSTMLSMWSATIPWVFGGSSNTSHPR